MRWLIFVLLPLASIATASGAQLPNRKALDIKVCGDSNYPPPTAIDWSARDLDPPKCETTGVRKYVPKYKGIGFQILDLESEACFVPDESYKILDGIIDRVAERIGRPQSMREDPQTVLAVSRATSDTLTELGFALWVPTYSLSDALSTRRTPRDKFRHIFDCDNGSMILMTVADVLGIRADLVEMTLPSGNLHNYVRWPMEGRLPVDWDMNIREQCVTPMHAGLPHQGKSLSRQQVMGYVLTLRGGLWEKRNAFSEAAADYLEAMKAFPERPGAYNSFAWVVATKVFGERQRYKNEALEAAKRAVAIRAHSDYLDTLACAYAFGGDFKNAEIAERDALEKLKEEAPGNYRQTRAVFEARLAGFTAPMPKDCTGAE